MTHDTTSDIASRLAALSPEQRRELLLGLASQQRPAGLHPVAPGRAVRASVQQEQLWFIDGYDEQAAPNNLIYHWTFRGGVDESRLRNAFAEVVARNESLRSHFVEADVLEIRLMQDRHDLPVVDVSDDPAARLEQHLQQARQTRFALGTGPLLRAWLLRLSDVEHVLILVVHHIVWDAASVQSFLAQLHDEYLVPGSGCAATARPVAAAVDYRSYAVWQRDDLERRGRSLRDAWRRMLADHPQTELASDRPRPARQTFGGALHEQTLIDGDDWTRLRTAGAALGATSYITSLALFTAVVAAWTRQDDVLIGSPVDLRTDPRLEGSIGYYVNMLPMRVPVSRSATVADHIAGVRDVVLEALDHRELPFADIVTTVNPPRDPSRSPLIQIEFAYEAAATLPDEWDGIRWEHGKMHDGGSRFDLSVIARESAEGVLASIEYNPDLYDATTIASFATAFSLALRHASRDVNDTLAALRLVDDVQGIVELGAEPVAHPSPAATAITRILEHVEACPGAPAIVGDDESLTYGELGERVRATAAWLRSQGVGTGDRVLVSAPQGARFVVAVLATHLVGAAFVPFDRAWPSGRRQVVADLTGARAVLVDTRIDNETGFSAPVAEIATIWGETASASVDVVPGDDAYVLFTSGTTGVPKGVAVGQGALAHFTREIVAAYRIDRDDVVLAFARPTFDVAVFDLFATLAAGAAMAIPSASQRMDPAELMSLMQRHHVTVAELPPALMPQLAPTALPELRLVSVGGEAFDGALIGSWGVHGRVFWNGYGPTESTVAVTLFRCETPWRGNPPIGRPIPGVVAVIVDDECRVLPRGAVGELLIAGPTLADGYLGDVATTAQSFVTLDLGIGSRRYFRTGDLCRWDGDGQLRFLGRRDDQTKVNGFRIELAEIEGALRQAPNVSDAAVAIQPVDGAGARLVGWIQSSVPGAVKGALNHVSSLLPEHAVPAALAVVPAIERTANGKVARDAMLRRHPVTAQRTDVGRALSETEQRVHDEVFAAILGEGALDPDASFFRLGGNSLQATRVVALLRERFGATVSVSDFFTASSIAAVAAGVAKDEARR